MEEEENVVDKYDLSTFINDKKTLLISDFEGTTPTTHFNKFKEYCTGFEYDEFRNKIHTM